LRRLGIAGRLPRRARGVAEALGELESGPLQRLQSGLGALARGDLTVAIDAAASGCDGRGGDELADAVAALYRRLQACVAAYDSTRRA